MIKHFCDICGAPANDQPVGLTYPFGTSYRSYKPEKGGESMYQPKCDVRVSFLADDHPKVSDGEPLDLCANCQIDLVNRLLPKLAGQVPS